MIELIAFLGNYGQEYAKNRHNAGWMLADHLSFASELNWHCKFKGEHAWIDLPRLLPMGSKPAREAPDRIHLIKPETYMNLSGQSVHEVATFYKIPPERILVIHDELELPLGTVSLKFSGGLGGHNGLRSMKASFGTADFWRFRIGIGRPPHDDISDWVLSDFTRDEAISLSLVLDAGARTVTEALVSGPEELLPEWSKKKTTL